MDLRKDALENVFDGFLRGSSVFRNREAIRYDYVPESLPHREEHIRYLAETLAPALKGTPCSNVFIYGNTGTGKTAVAKFVLNKLSEKANDVGSSVKVCFANCRLAGTEYRILSNVCSTLDVKVPFTGLALGEVFDRFRGALESEEVLLIVALDEVDAIVRERGDFLLYELTRVNESLRGSKVTILGISNDLRFKELLDPRVLSTLSEEEIVFKPYNAAELHDILRERAEVAFQEGALADGVVELCAAIGAAEHGDARRALDLLRVAAELAERKGDRPVSEDHVRQAQRRIEHDRVAEALGSLPTHSKMVLSSVFVLQRLNTQGATTGDIYDVYCELCGELGVSPLTRRRISGLTSELDVMGLLDSRVVSLGRHGRTRRTSLAVPRGVVRESLLTDERLRVIVNYNPRHLATLE